MKRHQDREKSSKLPDPLRSKAEEVWSGNETIPQRRLEALIFSHMTCTTPNQNVWRILVVNFTQILWTELDEFSINRKLLQSRLQKCDLPDPTQGSPRCYGRESSGDSQQWKTLPLLFVQAISLLTSLLQTS